MTTIISVVVAFAQRTDQPIKNGGFEAATPAESWRVESSWGHPEFSIGRDREVFKEGRQSLLISSGPQPVQVSLTQQVFLPVGTLWRLTGWVRWEPPSIQAAANGNSGPQIGMDSPVGSQGFSQPPPASGEWRQETLLFRVPSPGRMTVALKAFDHQGGKVWFDDLRLEPVPDPLEESVTISDTRLDRRPIDLKQGGQFIEPLNDVLPSMIAQQVRSTSFEQETPWTRSYRPAVDQPYRPWYPDGSVHLASYSYDTENPFNGKRSLKIVLPAGHTWAGVSQGGFSLDSGHAYRLRLHMRSDGNVRVRASLHGDGEMISGPLSLGRAAADWQAAEILLPVNRTVRDATLTIEFEGPGTLWLDRVYLIDKDAVLGIWRPDVVAALKRMNPGIVRFGGTTTEFFDWEQTLGNWDNRAPFPDDPWGGLQENFVGPEEVVKMVESIGAEPLLCIRWTGKTPQDAANEVEYFNGGVDTKWGQLRAKNGHTEPYHVKYWEVGNEVGGDEQGAEYDPSLVAFADAMRKVDPSIKILSSYPDPNIVRLDGSVLDFLSPHNYSIGDLVGSEDDLKKLQKEIQQDGNGKDIRLSITEWNVSGGEWGLTRGMLQTLGNGLSCSRYQNMLHRYADLVEIANLSNFSHSLGGGQLEPGPGYLYKTPSYYSQILYQRAAGSFSLRLDSGNPLSFYLREPDLNATLSPDGKVLRIYAVNSTSEIRKVNFHLSDALGAIGPGKVFVLGDSNPVPDSEAKNSRDDPERVSVRTGTASAGGRQFSYGFAPFTVTLLELELNGGK